MVKNHLRAVRALVRFLRVKGWEAMMKRVVSGWTLDNTSRSGEPSTLETMHVEAGSEGLSAVHHQRAESEPPMPMLTMSVMTWLV